MSDKLIEVNGYIQALLHSIGFRAERGLTLISRTVRVSINRLSCASLTLSVMA